MSIRFRNRRRATTVAAGLLAAGLGLLPLSARAQETLTLADAIAEALTHNDLLKAEGSRLAAAENAVGVARSYLLPRVALEERFVRTDNPAYDFSLKINQGGFSSSDLQGAPDSFNNPSPISDFQTSLTLTQPLYSRRAALGVAMARGEAAAVSLDRERRREEVANTVLQAWLQSIAAEAYREAAAKAEEDAAEHLRLAEVSEDAGVGLASDRLRAQVALGEARRMSLTVGNNLAIARRGLGLALGREAAVTPAGGELTAPVPDLEILLGRIEQRADLRAMAARVENAGRNVALAQAERLPEVGLFGSLQANDPDQPFGTSGTSYSVGVGVTWNLFAGFRTVAAERQAASERQRAETYLVALTKEARFRVQEAWLRRQEAQSSLLLMEEARTAAEEGVRLMRTRYENGLATMVALLDAQAALDRTRADVARARADLASALGELKFRSGTLLEELGVAGRADRTVTAVPTDAAAL